MNDTLTTDQVEDAIITALREIAARCAKDWGVGEEEVFDAYPIERGEDVVRVKSQDYDYMVEELGLSAEEHTYSFIARREADGTWTVAGNNPYRHAWDVVRNADNEDVREHAKICLSP